MNIPPEMIESSLTRSKMWPIGEVGAGTNVSQATAFVADAHHPSEI